MHCPRAQRAIEDLLGLKCTSELFSSSWTPPIHADFHQTGILRAISETLRKKEQNYPRLMKITYLRWPNFFFHSEWFRVGVCMCCSYSWGCVIPPPGERSEKWEKQENRKRCFKKKGRGRAAWGRGGKSPPQAIRKYPSNIDGRS